MPLKPVYHADVQYLQILDPQANLDQPLAQNLLTDDDLAALYEQMVISREFDEAALKLQRSGRMGTFPPNKGNEALALGAARAMRKGEDYFVGYYRENPALLWLGLPMHRILQHWMGDERANACTKNLAMNPITVAIGAQIPHAVGIAWAFKLRKEDRAVVCFFGEGATSTGDFHAGMNIAMLKKVPCVMCCANNQWAISVPRSAQTAAETIAQKALAYGMPTIQVDGNDIFAVYKAFTDALKRARAGEGPSFIEALTYRLGDHTTADDARRYRSEAELAAAMQLDPLIRTRKYLESRSHWTGADETKLRQRATLIVREAIDAALTLPPPEPGELFDSVFAELPPDLQKQRDTLRTDSLGQNPDQTGLKQPEPIHEEARR